MPVLVPGNANASLDGAPFRPVQPALAAAGASFHRNQRSGDLGACFLPHSSALLCLSQNGTAAVEHAAALLLSGKSSERYLDILVNRGHRPSCAVPLAFCRPRACPGPRPDAGPQIPTAAPLLF